MKDGGYKPAGCERRPRVDSAAWLAPVFHIYRVYPQRLTNVFALPYPAVRTPFTCLLDAAEPVWVLRYPVTIWRHPQTAKRYHKGRTVARITLRLGNISRSRAHPNGQNGRVHLRPAMADELKFTGWRAHCVRNDPPSGPVQRLAGKSAQCVAPRSGWSRSTARRIAATWKPRSATPLPR